MKWLLMVTLVAGVANGQWATPRPTATRRPTAPPAATSTPRPVATASPRPTSTPPVSATKTPPTPHAGLDYYLIPLVPVLTPVVGDPVRYADGTPIPITLRLASGEYRCWIVRSE